MGVLEDTKVLARGIRAKRGPVQRSTGASCSWAWVWWRLYRWQREFRGCDPRVPDCESCAQEASKEFFKVARGQGNIVMVERKIEMEVVRGDLKVIQTTEETKFLCLVQDSE